MILNIYAEDDGSVSASLPVFDGVEVGVNNIRAASEHINKQVFNGWMQDNAFDAMAKGYKQMLSALDENQLSQETMGELFDLLSEPFKPIKGIDQFRKELSKIADQLETNADRIKARKEAMASLPSSVDHMAGAGAPYVHEGTPGAFPELSGPITNLQDVADDAGTQEYDGEIRGNFSELAFRVSSG